MIFFVCFKDSFAVLLKESSSGAIVAAATGCALTVEAKSFACTATSA